MADQQFGPHFNPKHFGRHFAGGSSDPRARITGTVTSNLTQAKIVLGGDTIVITLTNDTWVAAGATFNAQRQAIINGVTSAQSEATGWNAEVRDNLPVTAVVRTSDTVVTVTLTAQAAYDIESNETITVTVPAAALVTSGVALVASPTFTVSVASLQHLDPGVRHMNTALRHNRLSMQSNDSNRAHLS